MDRAIVLAANSSWNLINFRAPIIAALQRRGYRVVAVVPDDDVGPILRDMSVTVEHVPIDARGISPWRDARLLVSYYALLRRLRPAAMLGFTAKPNIYGTMAATFLRIPVINTITGLGTGFLSGPALEWIVTGLYRRSLRRSARVFFHNPEDRDLFVDRKIVAIAQTAIVSGSGVNLQHFSPRPKIASDAPPTFLFIGRFLKDKGALEFAEAAAVVRQRHSARFRMLGRLEDHPKAVSRAVLQQFESDGTVEMLEPVQDVRPYIAEADCIVLPSYREGLPRVVLEASAMAKPVISTNVPGCRDAVDHGLTGLLCDPRSATSLADAMTAVIGMSSGERMAMGDRARVKAEREFSEEVVVAAYLDALRQIGV